VIPVEVALARVLDLCGTLEAEDVPLAEAGGRALARNIEAGRSQPPFAASAMDGYALAAALGPTPAGERFRVIGEAAAGRGFAGRANPGEAVRIFTGAPLPEGTDRVAIQEDVSRSGDGISLTEPATPGAHVRPAGGDFGPGFRIEAPRRLTAADLALAAAMGHARLPVSRRPEIAVIATGDELVLPGEPPGPGQIVASNGFGIKALLEAEGARVRLLPIARDTEAALRFAFDLAEGADMVVTIGGASVGEHDLVARMAGAMGLALDFHKVALRPGKPLMAGRLGSAVMVGLPGNPVSAIVCAHIFLRPAVRAMLGLGRAGLARALAPLAVALAPNGPREHYMRARLTEAGLEPFADQDSSLLSVLVAADALAIRPPGDGPREAGEVLEYIPLR